MCCSPGCSPSTMVLMAKRTNNTGSIFKEHDRNRWVALLVVGRSPDGKLIRKKFTGPTQKAVKARLDEAIVSRNVARLARRPGTKGEPRKIKALTKADVSTMLTNLEGSRWHPVAVVGVTTGLRPGELLALHWGDVHLVGNDPYLSVRHSITH